MKKRIAAALLAAAAVAGCSGGKPYPQGWQPSPAGSPGSQWTTGRGASQQTYAFSHAPFAGTLQDLGSRLPADVAKQYPGALFSDSDTFAPCPGIAAIATFRYSQDRVLVQGYAVQNGQAAQVTYVRPVNVGMGPDVMSAMEKALCVTQV